MKPSLYLIPVTLGNSPPEKNFPPYHKKIIQGIDHYIVEKVRSARRFLIRTGIGKSVDELNFYVLDKYTREEEYETFLNPLFRGESVGLLSEAGVPAVADPGSGVIMKAHQMHHPVVPLVGPSSVLLALMASGLNGQHFAFHGYLPVKKHLLIPKLKKMETISAREKQTQIFMETPYRNMRLFGFIKEACKSATLLCIATDINLETESIHTMTIGEWKKETPAIDRRPSVFLIQS